MAKRIIVFWVWVALVAGCTPAGVEISPSAISPTLTQPKPSRTASKIPTSTLTSLPSRTPTPSQTATPTTSATPTLVPSPTISPTATQTQPPPEGYVNVAQANCRYGPGWAYLYKFGLYEGISVEIQGRTERGDWVYVLPLWYESGCWIKADLLKITGDVFSVEPYYGSLPFSDIYPPPWITEVSRKGAEVFVAWSDVRMTADKYRGYLLETWLCQDGEIVFTPVNIDGLWTTFIDEPGCSEPSWGRIYSAEKHGYSQWRIIPWPEQQPTTTAMPR